MYQQRFLDGTPVDPAYQKAVASLISGACQAEEMLDLDELEQYADSQKSEPQHHRESTIDGDAA